MVACLRVASPRFSLAPVHHLLTTMKRLFFIPDLLLVCSLVVVLFGSAPAQAENSDTSSCFASSLAAFFDNAPDIPEDSVFLPVVPSKTDMMLAETVNFSVSSSVAFSISNSSVYVEQEGPWRRFLRWLCRVAVYVSTVDNYEDRVAGEFYCDEMLGT